MHIIYTFCQLLQGNSTHFVCSWKVVLFTYILFTIINVNLNSIKKIGSQSITKYTQSTTKLAKNLVRLRVKLCETSCNKSWLFNKLFKWELQNRIDQKYLKKS